MVDYLLEEYENNPFIKALPPIQSLGTSYEHMIVDQVFSEEEVKLPEELKNFVLPKLKRLYLPHSKSLDLEKRISMVMRYGYLGRNPLEKRQYQSLFNKEYMYEELHDQTDSFALIGIPGIGKSKTVEKVLSRYPKVVKHSAPINRYQITYLKLDCAHDSSLKTICMSFFSEIDAVLGTNYVKDFGRKTFSTSAMVNNMAHLSKLHALGILVIDEIQYLLSGQGSSYEKVMNFFVSLSNSVGVPLLLMGTMRAREILQRDFRQARRSCGVGDLVWENFKSDDKEWRALVKTVWKNQLLDEIPNLNDSFYNVLYKETQGVPDILVKLMQMSQVRALEFGTKHLTPELIQSVSKEDFQLIKPMLKALESNDNKELMKYDDLMPLSHKGKDTPDNKTKKKQSSSSLHQKTFDFLKEMGHKHYMLDLIIEKVIDEMKNPTFKEVIPKVLEEIEGVQPKQKLLLYEDLFTEIKSYGPGKEAIEKTYEYLAAKGLIKQISFE
ncbi:AAA family ATPase [Pontibacillus yanchengensis]|uniref:AAA family ATPase n=1 Tax=Pontibacillus yanchengensis TaxID=462910 RepID=A0ACC7VGC4_9BACI|nr:ATP-binding protein [Pontibacillus yanchengensis]MYL54026.1 AAA family ATPase [Pontibacillus yanchengensis]